MRSAASESSAIAGAQNAPNVIARDDEDRDDDGGPVGEGEADEHGDCAA